MSPAAAGKTGRKTLRVILVLLLLAVVAGALAVVFHRRPDPLASVMSVEKTADGRLWVMHYYGDYGFGDYLKRGSASVSDTAWSLASPPRWSCTCFAALGNAEAPLLGRNYDYTDVRPLILYTDPPDAFASISMVDVTFLGISTTDLSAQDRQRLLKAPYYPFDGMNEAGLAVGMMAVPLADGGKDPQKVTLASLEVIRLVLDYARDVPAAIALLQDYNVDFTGGPPIHYLMADAAGNSAVIEYLNGEPVVIQNKLPWQVATNFILSGESLATSKSICSRYKTAYETLGQAKGLLSAAESLSLLQAVSQPITSWSIVYDLNSGEVQVALDRDFAHVLDFSLEMKAGE